MLQFLPIALGLAGSVASAAGTLAAADGADAGVGLGLAQAEEQRLNLLLQRNQVDFAATIAELQGKVGATQIKTNADMEAASLMMNASMQAAMYRFQGATQLMQAEYEELFLDRQSKRALAQGQDEFFAGMEQLEYLQSDLQANAAASGFMATDASTLDVGEDLEMEGYTMASRSLAKGKQAAADLVHQGDVTRIRGEMANTMAEFEADTSMGMARFASKNIVRQADIEASIFKQNKELEAAARRIEASGYGAMASQAMLYGQAAHTAEIARASATKTAALFNAGTTLLGGAASFANDYQALGGSGFGFHPTKSTVDNSGLNSYG